MINELTPFRETRVAKDLLQEGYEKGQAQIIAKALKHGISIEQIAKITELTREKNPRDPKAVLKILSRSPFT